MGGAQDERFETLYYEPSGRFSGIILLIPPLMAVAVFPAAWLYAWLVINTFFRELAFFAFLGYSAYLAVASAWIVERCQLRSPLAAALTGLACGAVALYLTWVLFVWVQFAALERNVALGRLLASPDLLWQCIESIRTSDWYRISTLYKKAGVGERTLSWLAEAVVIFIVPFIFGTGQTNQVFCERCRRWAEQKKDALVFKHPDPSDLKEKLIAQDLSFLEEAGPAKKEPSYLSLLNPGADREREYAAIRLEWCPQCNQLHVLTAESIRQKFYVARAQKRKREKNTTLVDQMLITPETFEGVMAARERFGSFVEIDRKPTEPDEEAEPLPGETGGGASMPNETKAMEFEPEDIEVRYGPRFYKPSGRVSPAVLLVPPLMLVLAFPSAWLYAWLAVNTFFKHAPWLLFFVYLLYTAWANVFLIRKGKVCSLGLAMGLGGLFAAVIHLLAWSHFVHMVLAERGQEIAMSRLLSSPSLLWGSIETIRTSDWHTTLSSPSSRAFWWIAETLGVFLFSVVPAAASSQDAFCRRCRRWTRTEKGSLFFTCPNPGAFKEKLLNQDPGFVGAATPATTKDLRYYEIKTESCPGCRELHVIRLEQHDRQWIRGKNKTFEKKDHTTLVEKLLITPEMHAQMASHRDRLGDLIKVDEDEPGPHGERNAPSDPGSNGSSGMR